MTVRQRQRQELQGGKKRLGEVLGESGVVLREVKDYTSTRTSKSQRAEEGLTRKKLLVPVAVAVIADDRRNEK